MKVCMVSVRNDEFSVVQRQGMDTNDVNLAYLLGATEHYWCGERDLNKFDQYDMIFFLMSKIKESYENKWMELVSLIRDKYGDKKIILIHQEAEMRWCMYRPWKDQLELFEAIKKADMFMCHNTSDIGFFKFLCPETKVICAPTPMPIEKIKKYRINPKVKRNNEQLEIIFGTSFDHRSNGLLGYAVAMELKRKYGKRIKITQYHRTQWNDNRNEEFMKFFGYDFEVLPHMSWLSFVERLSQSYISMNLMSLAAAGRDAIVFSALGIPHISNEVLEVMNYDDVSKDNIEDLRIVFKICELLIEGKPERYIETIEDGYKNVEKHSFQNVKKVLNERFKFALGIDI